MIVSAAVVLTTVQGVTMSAARALPSPAAASAPELPTPELPTPPASEFDAPTCPGTTTDDPGALTRVADERLDLYNAGYAVMLYDGRGELSNSILPACGVRYEPSAGGPVSDWMFCTDMESHACIVADDGSPVGPLEPLPGNPRLSSDQELMIAYLIRHGHSFTPNGVLTGATFAEANNNTSNREALQALIWCISDYDEMMQSNLAPVCDVNIGAEEQARILALAEVPEPVLDLARDGDATRPVGERVRFTIETNLFDEVITIQTSGPDDLRIKVCAGDANLDGDELTVHGDDPATTATVTLCVKAGSPGPVTLSVSATESTVGERITWAQVHADPDAEPCQVFASFHDVDAELLSAEADVVLVAKSAKTRPVITTQVSDHVVVPGARLFDKVRIRGLKQPYSGKASASLYGPFSSRSEAQCTTSALVKTVSFRAHNGLVRTPRVKVTTTGYYTWVARLGGDAHNKAATHRCGLAPETALARKKPLERIPDIEAGYAGTARAAKSSVGTLRIPGIGLRGAPVQTMGLRNGDAMLPGDVSRLGVLNRTAQPGDRVGTAVIAGHVSDDRNRPGAMWNLRKASRGDIVTYVKSSGETVRYRVVSKRTYDRGDLPAGVFDTASKPRLALVTCDGIDWNGNRFHYTKNIVVMAERI